ncbi:MAG: tRNA (adenosine(37)-N6)-threonylcarbamoyltransferase complex dimerization subunit type 1 TsaB [Sediminibacterium sp.]
MALLLNIDTATGYAGVCISRDGDIVQMLESHEQKNHASFVQPAIQQLLEQTGYRLNNIDAVAVTAGPGSYTGLRVGLASAKGICFALDKPLILVNTLEVIAQSMIAVTGGQEHAINNQPILLCPLIDARRMEVFTAVYDLSLTEIYAPQAMVLDENSFSSLLSSHRILFGGSGHQKLKQILIHPNAAFTNNGHHVNNLAQLAHRLFIAGTFADLVYSDPFYVKEFFNPHKIIS